MGKEDSINNAIDDTGSPDPKTEFIEEIKAYEKVIRDISNRLKNLGGENLASSAGKLQSYQKEIIGIKLKLEGRKPPVGVKFRKMVVMENLGQAVEHFRYITLFLTGTDLETGL